MKKNLSSTQQQQGANRKYWRSLDELTQSAEFEEELKREFPEGASELVDPVSRRSFVKLMSASALFGGVGLTGCRPPEEKILPFAKAPEDYVHGVARRYATAMPTRGSAIPLVVKSNDGRPTKVEGNSDHPDSNGGTDTFTQASILNLYDPDRATRFSLNGEDSTREAAFKALGEISAKKDGNVRFLMERSSSPSRLRLQQDMAANYPSAKWHLYEPVDLDRPLKSGASKAVRPYYRLEDAKTILSLDCDFIGAEQDAYRHIAAFAKRRKLNKAGDEKEMNRLYAVEGLMTQTGMNADQRLRVAPSQVLSVALAIAQGLDPQHTEVGGLFRQLPKPASVPDEWIKACVADLAAHKGQSVVVAGYGQPEAVHALADLINQLLGNFGKTVFYQEFEAEPAGTIQELAKELDGGQVDTLVIVGGNPVYNAPTDLNWAAAQAKAKTVVRLSYYEDETSFSAELYSGVSSKPQHWDLPAAHYLESWGDARTADGTVVPVQPLIAPLFGGLTELEVLARVSDSPISNPNEIVQATFHTLADGGEEAWKKFLHDGFLEGSAFALKGGTGSRDIAGVLGAARALPTPTDESLEVVFTRDYSVDDGRFNNNGWLQELPDAVTKLTWENVFLISPTTAKKLGLDLRDLEKGSLDVPVVTLELGGKTATGPIWVQPGMADNMLAVALGYGRTRSGRIGDKAGFNAYKLRTSATMSMAPGGKIATTGKMHELATTQNHWRLEGRTHIREANLSQYEEHPDFARKMDFEEAPDMTPLYENPLDKLQAKAVHAWGMSVDLNSCVGCSACVVACQAENNIPIVGKQQVAKSREMHWIRLDRYYAGPIEDPQVVTQPMLCQHCEAAPCESVCPVNATVHDQEGLNLMAYNRCVGTRYCSNNCPYKVRRFNYFDYNRRPINNLYESPFTRKSAGGWDLKRWWNDPTKGSIDDDTWNLVSMAKNPDVSVRMRGVMEKCSFCLQRIQEAKISQKVKARDSDDTAVPDGVLKTACQQACPAEAISFGNIKDSHSQVSQLKANTRDYTVLDMLATKPRLTYMARVRNPNSAIALPGGGEGDLPNGPYSLKEFSDKNGNPFKAHGGHDDHGAAPHGAEKGGH